MGCQLGTRQDTKNTRLIITLSLGESTQKLEHTTMHTEVLTLPARRCSDARETLVRGRKRRGGGGDLVEALTHEGRGRTRPESCWRWPVRTTPWQRRCTGGQAMGRSKTEPSRRGERRDAVHLVKHAADVANRATATSGGGDLLGARSTSRGTRGTRGRRSTLTTTRGHGAAHREASRGNVRPRLLAGFRWRRCVLQGRSISAGHVGLRGWV